jgi:hypothetical protein
MACFQKGGLEWFRFEKQESQKLKAASKAAIAAETETSSTYTALPSLREGCLQQIKTQTPHGVHRNTNTDLGNLSLFFLRKQH